MTDGGTLTPLNNEQIDALCEGLQPLAEDEFGLVTILNSNLGRLVTTLDRDGAPFHAVTLARLADPRLDRPSRIILWLDPTPLQDNWQPATD